MVNRESLIENYPWKLSLNGLLWWIIIGPKYNVDLAPVKNNPRWYSCAKYWWNNYELCWTKKQVSCNSAGENFSDSAETPITVGLGLYVHQHNRSKKVINTLSGLKLRISYYKVLQIEISMASVIAENMNKIEGVFLPPHICKGIAVEFAIDNTDFSTDQKLEFHGTGQLVFQKRKRKYQNRKTKKENI